MEPLVRQVNIAARRLFWQQFLACWVMTLGVFLLIAAVAIGVRKFVDFPVESQLWSWSWLGGGAIFSLITAGLWAYFIRPRSWEAAWEIDHRFDLKERVSSSLTLPPEERETPAGQALVSDALKRVERLEIAEKFPLRWSRSNWWPLAPAALALGLLFLSDPQTPQLPANTPDPAEVAKQIAEATEPLKKQFEEQHKEAVAEGLKETAALMDQLLKQANEIQKQAKNKQLTSDQAVGKLNDLAKQLEKRRDQVGGDDKLKQQLNALKQPGDGPADNMAQALKNNDFEQAAEQFDKLAEQLKKDNLDPANQQKLEQQLNKLAEQLNKQQQARDQAKKDLENQIAQLQKDQAAAQKNNQPDQANKLAQQLEQLKNQLDQANRHDPQQQKLQNLAKQLEQAAQGLKNGNQQQAQQAMQNMQNQMQQMAKNDREMQMLDRALAQLGECKGNCNGNGQNGQQGQGKQGGQMAGGNQPGDGKQPGPGKQLGFGNQPGEGGNPQQMAGGNQPGNGQQPGQGLGAGQGQQQQGNQVAGAGQGGLKAGQGAGGAGQKVDPLKNPKFRDTQANSQVEKGPVVITGEAGGPNEKGNINEQIKLEVAAAKKDSAEAVNRQRLPKHQREQVQEYFDALRNEGK
ncbi:MAG: hypothetical protein SFX18_16745 [Pirellulales bacterium]|nr:hypothetical protein [Pirellulales bacterium]